MKNPNGYGTVTKLSGNRRRPFIVKEGISGKQKVIGYAATREEGMILLAGYNHCPWNPQLGQYTFRQLYQEWLRSRAQKLGASSRSAMTAAYRYCAPLEQSRYREIKSYQMQYCIDTCGKGYATQGAIRNLLRHLDRFAKELDIIDKSAAELLTVEPTPPTTRTVFTEEEIAAVHRHAAEPWADSILFLLYTGFRISEMLNLRTEDVDLQTDIMIGGTKTEAGRRRTVPIHPQIKTIVAKRYAASRSGYLFEYKGKKLSTTQYRRLWNPLMETLSMSHTPHECRHTFRSLLDSAGANKVCIDRMMGHVSLGTGERIYTHKTIDELKSNLLLITNS